MFPAGEEFAGGVGGSSEPAARLCSPSPEGAPTTSAADPPVGASRSMGHGPPARTRPPVTVTTLWRLLLEHALSMEGGRERAARSTQEGAGLQGRSRARRRHRHRLLNGLHVPSPSHAELRTDAGQRGTWRARPAGGGLDGELVAAQTRDIPVNETDRADTSRYVRVSTANLTRLELTRHVLVTPQFKTTNTRK